MSKSFISLLEDAASKPRPGASDHPDVRKDLFTDHKKNPYFKVIEKYGWKHKETRHQSNHLASHRRDGDYTEHVYVNGDSQYKKDAIVVTQYHVPKREKQHWRLYYEQKNGIMSPTAGDTKPQLDRSLSDLQKYRESMREAKGDDTWRDATGVKPGTLKRIDGKVYQAQVHPVKIKGTNDDYETKVLWRVASGSAARKLKESADPDNGTVGNAFPFHFEIVRKGKVVAKVKTWLDAVKKAKNADSLFGIYRNGVRQEIGYMVGRRFVDITN